MMLAEIWVGFSVKGRRFFYPSFAERVQVREQNKITNVTWSTVDSFSTPETHAMWGLFLVVVAAVILLSRQLLTRIPSRFEKKRTFWSHLLIVMAKNNNKSNTRSGSPCFSSKSSTSPSAEQKSVMGTKSVVEKRRRKNNLPSSWKRCA